MHLLLVQSPLYPVPKPMHFPVQSVHFLPIYYHHQHEIINWCVPFNFKPSWITWTLIMAYTKAKLKSNGGKTSPYFKPGARLDVSDKRKIPFPSALGIRTPHRSVRSPSGEETQMEDFTSCMWCHRAVDSPLVCGCRDRTCASHIRHSCHVDVYLREYAVCCKIRRTWDVTIVPNTELSNALLIS